MEDNGGGGMLETEYRIEKKKIAQEKKDVLTFASFPTPQPESKCTS